MPSSSKVYNILASYHMKIHTHASSTDMKTMSHELSQEGCKTITIFIPVPLWQQQMLHSWPLVPRLKPLIKIVFYLCTVCVWQQNEITL